MTTNKPIQVRLTPPDKDALERGKEFLSKRNLGAPTTSEVVRFALRYTFSPDGMLCPHCLSPLVERTDEEGGPLGEWYCPGCS